ncbi:hemolysins and related proteins containing CBS domains [Halalkalibacter wakoensis JCM 9140]|uniref:Hemolysins and related proteins containing CBS domains n=1 Tax=Halalkalibacter wakoensis JCM 9140 TaxID=1236970 RepID=W4PZV9_9BACI|nr:hemolysin family protein [Halalkalibacter wakoensis]GAE24978.1 hemolysins and related proteins containing CBS domains [Halalkalibacter wakoensis JCM 9140]
MTQIPLSLVFLLAFLLFLSAFFSSAETAFSSVNKIRLKNYAEEGVKGSNKALRISTNFDETLTTILVGNNLVNIAAATLSSQLAIAIFGPNLGVFISTFVLTILVLIFGEILPKSFAKEYAETYTLKTATIMTILVNVFRPVTWAFIQLRKGISRFVRKKEHHPSMTEEEIKVMIDISEEEGVIESHEKELVHRSLEFNDIIVAEILKPRTDIVAVNRSSSIDEIKDVFFREQYSRIPIFEGSIDNIVGILSEKDFLKSLITQTEPGISDLLRTPLFVVESMKVSKLLPELQKQKTHMAIVIDEYGGTAGLITLEDILEEIVGEIWDEHDEKVKLLNQIDATTYMIAADYPLDDFVRLTNVNLPPSSYHTLGGWLTEKFQRFPQKGEQLTYEHITLQVESTEEKRLREIKVSIYPT